MEPEEVQKVRVAEGVCRNHRTRALNALIATLATATGAPVIVAQRLRLDSRVKAAIAGIPADAWTRIEYPHPI